MLQYSRFRQLEGAGSAHLLMQCGGKCCARAARLDAGIKIGQGSCGRVEGDECFVDRGGWAVHGADGWLFMRAE